MYFFVNTNNTNFHQFFSICANFDEFRLNFGASLCFFSVFFSIVNNLLSVFYSRIPSFYMIIYVFFCFKMNIIPVVFQFLPILTIFGLILGCSCFFLPILLIDHDLSCLLYFSLTSFYNFLCIFLGQNAYNINFLPIFTNYC